MARVYLTNHAERRFKERWKKGGTAKEVAQKAFDQGKNLSRGLLKTTTIIGFTADGYWTATYKVYKRYLFVFQKDGEGTYVLQTIYPLKYLLEKRSQMLHRHLQNKIKTIGGHKFTKKEKEKFDITDYPW